MPKIVEYKFILPPILALMFLYWADPTFIINGLHLENNMLSLFFGTLGIFAVGFGISTLNYVWINWLIIKNIDELKMWDLLMGRGEFLQTQMAKRWDMFVANVNALLALFVVVLLIVSIGVTVSPLWVFSITILIACFVLNGIFIFIRHKKIYHDMGYNLNNGFKTSGTLVSGRPDSISLVISFFSLGIALASFLSGIYISNRLLPTQQAYVIASDPEIHETRDQLQLTIYLKNLGEASAERVKYRIYNFYSGVQDPCLVDKVLRNPIFSEELALALGKKQEVRLAYLLLNKSTEIPIPSVILFQLGYTDSVTGNEISNLSGWQYTVYKDKQDVIGLTRKEINKYQKCMKYFNLELE